MTVSSFRNRFLFRTALTLTLPALPLAAALVGVSLSRAATPPALPKAAAPSWKHDVATPVEKYCLPCHGKTMPSGEVTLVGITQTDTLLAKRAVWEKVAANVESRHMPPTGMPRPTDAEREKLSFYIESNLAHADCKLNDPGRVTMRRLNRAEYDNSVRDLTGLDLRLSADFPSDDVGYGFDNIGDVLSLSPLLLEKYVGAAGKIARALVKAPEDTATGEKWEGSKLAATGGFDTPLSEGRLLYSNGNAVEVTYNAPVPARYLVRVRAWQERAGPEAAKVGLKIAGKDAGEFSVEPTKPRDAKSVETTVFLPAGEQKIAASFTNDYYDMTTTDPKLRGDRNLVIESLAVEGPLDVPRAVLIKLATPSTEQTRLLAPGVGAPNDTERARRILRAFARRAFRRPPTDDETARLVSLYGIARKNNESFERGIQLGVQATLASPHFLFRAERDTGQTRPLDDYELAARLSYFIWSSVPDETLLQLAGTGKLHNPAILTAQAKRMLHDPKAAALTDNFAGQWLQLRKLDRVTPDPKQFPDFDETLRASMREETRRYFTTIVHEDRSVLEFIDSDWTFLNGRLARHYGNTRVTGDDFVRVKLTGGNRGGVLTQAAILTLTSNPTRTSPVKRGKWVLDNLLNTPPPPPPPGVAQLPDDKKNGIPLTGTLRQRLEQHRANPTCASCHSRMDPIGFGLENFNAIGAWRKTDGNAPIDATGTLPDGRTFNGPGELRYILLQKKELFTRALTEKLLTYAIGRGIESTDRCNVSSMAGAVAAKGYHFSALIEQIVLSDPFRKRRSTSGNNGATGHTLATATRERTDKILQ